MTKQKKEAWHDLSLKKVFEILETSPAGLTPEEASLRKEKYGPNLFKKKKKNRLIRLIIKQTSSPLVFILLVAGIVTIVLKEFTDATIIFAVVVINTVIGVVQEGKASRAFEKLRESQKKFATVVRGDSKHVIPSEDLVPGDIIVVSAGDQVSADARLIESKGLEVNESALTGEWMASPKSMKKLKKEAVVSERHNMIWMGTFVTEGWGTAIVVSTAFETEVGKIAEMIGEEKETLTPFQRSVKNLARFLGFVILGVLILIFSLGIFRGQPAAEMFLLSVAIAVAAIPEGLPVAVTVVLSLGMEKILSCGGLVKRMNATETLGSVDVILTDKTGTLTQSLMRVADVITLESAHFDSKSKKLKSKKLFKKNDDSFDILKMAVLVTDAYIENPEEGLAEWTVRGRPLEQAIVLAGVESGLYKHKLLKEQPRIDFMPFEAERRFSASLHEFKKNTNRMYINGAPEYVLASSKKVYKKGRIVAFSKQDKELLEKVLKKQASSGIRVVAIGFKQGVMKEFPRASEFAFDDLVFGGFVAFHDPLRPDVAEAIKSAERAGINISVVTGDHEETAKKISEEVGVFKEGDRVVLGEEIEKMDDKELKELVQSVSVFARVVPHQKFRIVKAWQELGKTVAMTGDGVNDAPALRRAEIGVALGSGTEVAKEASGIVLLNNSFSVIIAAIEEGRKILMNLRRILVYLLSTAFSEVVLIAFCLFFGLPLAILPKQILWANLVQEGFMNFGFAFEPKEDGIMESSPENFSSKKLLNKESKWMIAILMLTDVFLVGLFLLFYFVLDYSIEYTRTVIFGALSIGTIFYAFSLKNFTKPIWKINVFSNYYLLGAASISVAFLAGALFVPPLRFLLSLEKLDFFAVSVILVVGFANILCIELVKHFFVHKKVKRT